MSSKLSFKEIWSEVKAGFMEQGIYTLSISEKFCDIVAYYLTPLFLATGLSANAITTIGFSISVTALTIVAFDGPNALVIGFALYALSTFFDHIDGRVAKAKNNCTYFGKFYDGMVDLTICVIFRVALCIVIFKRMGTSPLFYVASLCTFLTPFQIFMLDRYSAFSRWITDATGVEIVPYIRLKSGLKMASVFEDLERLGFGISIFYFAAGMWLHFSLGLIMALFYLIYHFHAAYKNFRVPFS